MNWILSLFKKRPVASYDQILNLATKLQQTKVELNITEMRSALSAIIESCKQLEAEGYDVAHLFKD